MKDDLRVAIYGENNGCMTFYKDTQATLLKKFNYSPYIALRGKGARLYFYPATPGTGLKIGENGRVQMSRPELLADIRKFVGSHKMRYDETFQKYYIEAAEERPERPAERPKKAAETNVEGILMGCLFESIDGDDIAGAKAILKAMRKIENAKKGA